MGRFLEHLERQGRTERHWKNVRNYLAQWAEALFEKELRCLRLQDLKQFLNGWYDDAKRKVVAKRHRIAAIKSFFSWLREEEAVLTTAEDPTLALKVPGPSGEGHARQGVLHAGRGAPLRRDPGVGVQEVRLEGDRSRH